MEKYYHTLFQIYFCGYFISLKGTNGDVICILPIFEVVFGQDVGTLAPGVTLYSVTTCCLAIYIEVILSYFVSNIFLCPSKCPNWEVIWILPIFGVIFGQHLCTCPSGWPYIVSPPAVWSFILYKCYHTLLQIYFCGYFISSKGLEMGKLFANYQ